jgi:nitrogen-specific signal transduction histidine kinase
VWGLDKVFAKLPAYSPFIPHFVIFLLLSIALIYFVPRIKGETGEGIEKVFFKKKFKYREALREFSKRLVLIPGEEQLLNEAVNNLATAMEVAKVAIMLMDDLSGNYIVQASWGLDEKAKKLVFTPQDGIIKWLRENKKVFFIEEIDKILSLEEIEKIKTELKDMQGVIYLPLIIHNQLGGVLALGEKLSRKEMFSHIDIELLEGFTNQLALSISYKRLESQIVRADRLVSLGTLAAGMAHEIRNPLSSIQTFAQLLPEKYNDREFREEFSKIVASDTQRISRIIESVMALANPRPYIPVSCNANELLDKALFLIEGELKKDGVKVTRNYAAQLPQIKADKEQLQQVFLNIFLNALAALSKDDGKLTISTRQKLIPSIVSGQEKKYVQIEIKDSGIGIEKKLLDRIFEPFFTTRPNGTGLGLAIVHRIIEQHRGFIKVDSDIGKGTAFLINLPMEEKND